MGRRVFHRILKAVMHSGGRSAPETPPHVGDESGRGKGLGTLRPSLGNRDLLQPQRVGGQQRIKMVPSVICG